VAYAGPLAGIKEEFTEISGNRVLVQQFAKLIVPAAGGFPLI